MRLTKYGLRALAYLAYVASRKASLRRIVFNSIRLNRVELERFRTQEEFNFLAYVFLKRSELKAQILQDLWVCYELGERRGGFFVEFGATNGVVNSNTWLLEKRYNWKGILAEANPVWHEQLSESRQVAIDRRCVGASTGEVVAFLTTNSSDPELSSIAEFAGGDHFDEVRAQGVLIGVETVSLNDLLVTHNAPSKIDYLSIDTEGSEYEILSRFDFSSYSIDLLSIELNKKTEAKIEAMLAEHDYIRVFKEFSQWDGWFVKSDRRRQVADLGTLQQVMIDGRATDSGGGDRKAGVEAGPAKVMRGMDSAGLDESSKRPTSCPGTPSWELAGPFARLELSGSRSAS